MQLPTPVIVPRLPGGTPKGSIVDLRQLRVDEFLQAKSVAPSTERGYRKNLRIFMNWVDTPWESVTPRQVAQFKSYLLRSESGKRVYSDGSIGQILGTLRNFLGWMQRSRYINDHPGLEVDLPKLPEPEARNLTEGQVASIVDAIQHTSLPERNLALIGLLSHGLRPSEPCGLNIEDWDGSRVYIRKAKADSKGFVPITGWSQLAIDAYLEWRTLHGDALAPEAPLIVSHSHRNQGQRITYDTVRKLVNQLQSIAGFEFHAHQLRHTFATHLVLKGMNPYHVKTLTRHKDERSFRRYTKAADYLAAEQAYRELEP